MKLVHSVGRGVCSPSRLPTAVVCQAQRGFGSRKRASAKKLKPGTVNTEAQQLLGEYSAVKQPGRPLGLSGSSRASPSSRTKQPTTEASAATQPAPLDSASPQHTAATQSGSLASSSSTTNTPGVKPAGWGSSSETDTAPPEPASPAADAAPSTSGGSATPSATPSGSAAAAPAAGSSDVDLPLPVPGNFKAAGARHSVFESKLTGKSSPAGPPLPRLDDSAAASSSQGQQHLVSTTISRLSAARDDLAAAGAHVEGLAQLLQEAQATLASLQSVEGPADAAVSVAAGQLVGLMSDVLSDITADMGLVCGQLGTARGDIDSSLAVLEEAVASPEPQAGLVSIMVGSSPSAALNPGAAAADTPRAAAEAEREAAALQAELELKDAELAVVQQRNSQLHAQLALLTSGEPGGPQGDGQRPIAQDDPGVRALLASQVATHIALLDWLGALAKSVVGLEGVAAADRVRLVTTISKCVLAVGGSSPGSSSSNNGTGLASVGPASSGEQQE